MRSMSALRMLIGPTAKVNAMSAGTVYALVMVVIVMAMTIAEGQWSAAHGNVKLSRGLALSLVVALVSPVIVTCATAGRLSQRHRRRVLSTVRLVGGSSTLIRRLSLAGEMVVAVAGVVMVSAAVIVATLLRRLVDLVAQIPAIPLAGAALVVVLAAAVNASTDLRAVLNSPLSVRRRSNAALVRSRRLFVGVALVAGALSVARMIGPEWGVFAVVAAATLSIFMINAALGLLGPWVVSLLASRALAGVTNASQLMALRDILDSSVAAWRHVSALAVTCFLIVPVGLLLAYLSLIQKATPGLDPDVALAIADIRTTGLTIVASTVLLTLTTTGAAQYAAIEERRELHVSLYRMGMPARAIAQARLQAACLPFNVAFIGSVSLSLIFFWWLVIPAAASLSVELFVTGAVLAAIPLAFRALTWMIGRFIRHQVHSEATLARGRVQRAPSRRG